MSHRFRFRRGELELELEGERDFIEAQLARFAQVFGLEAPEAPASPEAGSAVSETDGFRRVPADFRPRVTLSLAEFAALKQAVAPVDLLVVAGYYIEKYGRTEAYTRAELLAHLGTLRAFGPDELETCLDEATRCGYVQGLPGERFTLTFKGQAYVREGLDPDAL